ncbi:hypothetical protein [Solilutibacter silvestris]|uniref:hypothetical protein n=1 Tax=Solilutibacter silvestris TaxID=1645665 RepID=UPI00101AD96D|nr:hypothetical protein [Lysobacter silvestris]
MEKSTRTRSAIWFWLPAILSVGSLVDFIWYGHHIYNLLEAVGFGLMAFATYRNAPLNLKEATTENSYLFWISVTGLVVAICGMLVKYTIKI